MSAFGLRFNPTDTTDSGVTQITAGGFSSDPVTPTVPVPNAPISTQPVTVKPRTTTALIGSITPLDTNPNSQLPLAPTLLASVGMASNTPAPAPSTSGPITSTGGTSSGDTGSDESAISRLLDLASMQFNSSAPASGGNGLGGLVATPIDGTGQDAVASSSSSGLGKLILVGLVLAVAFFIYRNHKKKKAGEREPEHRAA